MASHYRISIRVPNTSPHKYAEAVMMGAYQDRQQHDCMDAEGRATHNSRDGVGRATQEAKAEEQLPRILLSSLHGCIDGVS